MVQGALFDEQSTARDLFEPQEHRVAVERAEGDSIENKKLQRAWE